MTEGILDELRTRFRETTAERLLEMFSELDALDRDNADAASLQALLRNFHALSGLGSTCGYPRITDLGDEGESAILPLQRRGGVPSPSMLERWRTLTNEVQRELAADDAEPAGVSEEEQAGFDVLVVENDAELAATLSSALQEQAMGVRVVSTCAEGMVALERRVPGALIFDAVLPDGTGYEVLEAMRARNGGDSAGAIVLSEPLNFVDKLRAMRGGADAFVNKPLDLQGVVRRVQAFRARRELPPRRILAVEDDATQRFLLQRVLGSAGYEVAVCSDPNLFEQKLLEFMPDLVLMDVYLSDDDVRGYDLVRYVRQNELFAGLPVIFVTSATERKARLESATSGGDLLISKPVDWQMLLAQIESLLQRAAVLRDRAERDVLTGLLTRAMFESRANQRLGRSGSAALALIDVDHFKSVNDTHGHLSGDRVLSSLGALLRRCVRPSDAAGRYGGEEFALLLEGVTGEQAVPIVERMLAEFAAIEQGPVGKVTFSAGAATLEGSFDATFRRADAALYEAKRSGRARVVGA
jgi:diguanylate cyclase (GGDEF)-like protein